MSSTGVPSKQSKSETVSFLPLRRISGTKERPIGFGRDGESSAKTPTSGSSSSFRPYLSSPLGLTLSRPTCSGLSLSK